jgi:hypothetical protein
MSSQILPMKLTVIISDMSKRGIHVMNPALLAPSVLALTWSIAMAGEPPPKKNDPNAPKPPPPSSLLVNSLTKCDMGY